MMTNVAHRALPVLPALAAAALTPTLAVPAAAVAAAGPAAFGDGEPGGAWWWMIRDWTPT